MLVFPLDFPAAGEAIAFARRLGGRVGLFKVGLELFVAAGPAILPEVRKAGGEIFLDLKFHDIPATVRSAAAAATRLGVRFISVHAAGGEGVLEAAVEGAGSGAGVLAVTVLTSLDRRQLAGLGMRKELTDPGALVIHRAAQALRAGCEGVVCSGREVRAVKKECGEDFAALVPGVRPEWAEVRGDDQARVVTPAAAVRSGADYVVVGRPIRLAPDPVMAAERTVEEIEAALS